VMGVGQFRARCRLDEGSAPFAAKRCTAWRFSVWRVPTQAGVALRLSKFGASLSGSALRPLALACRRLASTMLVCTPMGSSHSIPLLLCGTNRHFLNGQQRRLGNGLVASCRVSLAGHTPPAGRGYDTTPDTEPPPPKNAPVCSSLTICGRLACSWGKPRAHGQRAAGICTQVAGGRTELVGAAPGWRHGGIPR